MIINGGLDHNAVPLQDLWCYNLEHNKWSQLYVEKHIPALSHHSSTVVFTHPFRISSLYKPLKEISIPSGSPKVI